MLRLERQLYYFFPILTLLLLSIAILLLMKYYVLTFASAICLASCSNNNPEPSPVAAFTAPTSAEQAGTVSFQNESQHASRYTWRFGDGSSAQDKNPTHTYAQPGTYSVTLSVFGAEKKDSVTKTIIIQPYNLFERSSLPFAGTYRCKVVRHITPPMQYPGSRTRLPDQEVVITKEGSGTVLWNGMRLTYSPFQPTSPQLPDGSKFTFSIPRGPESPRFAAYASFHTSGDSATFRTEELSGAGGGRTEVIYYGIRRP